MKRPRALFLLSALAILIATCGGSTESSPESQRPPTNIEPLQESPPAEPPGPSDEFKGKYNMLFDHAQWMGKIYKAVKKGGGRSCRGPEKGVRGMPFIEWETLKRYASEDSMAKGILTLYSRPWEGLTAKHW